MGIKERRDREKNELRTLIMDAARAIIIENGVDAVSMRKIAERIEYSPTAIYQHFPDKESLVRTMCLRDFEALTEEMREQAQSADPIQRIRMIGEVYLRFAIEYPDHFRVMFMTPITYELTDNDRQKLGNPEVDGYANLRDAVIEALQQNRLRDDLDDPDLVVQTLWASVHGVAALQATHSKDPWVPWKPFQQRAQAMIDAILRGVLRDPAEIASAREGRP